MVDAAGHRQRLWTRLKQAGFRHGFAHDYEKLEFLLTFALPRRDTKPLAKALLQRFGSLSGVVHAPLERLQELDGVGEKTALFIRMLHDLVLTLDEADLEKRDLLQSADQVKAYLRKELAWEEAEYLLALFLDNHNQLIGKGRLFRGTVNHVAHYPRELAKEALANNASRVIIAHNHPSGSTKPSKEDIQATEKLAKALHTVGVVLLDHFVIGRSQVVGLVELGLYQWSPDLGKEGQ